MRQKNQNRSCPDVLSNECIVWQGGDVPALGIENGDQLSESEYIITQKILELFDDIDMSEIDLNCIQTTCQQKCKDTSLKAIIQLLFDNQCCLNDLITAGSGETSTTTVNLNMRCLTILDDFGNPIPQDLNQSLQSIINQVCSNTTSITSINATLTSLQNQIDDIETTPVTVPEPNITTCISPGLQPVSQVVPIVAQALCTYQTAIGQTTDLSIAMSQQCANLNTLFGNTKGWLSSVQNFAQSMNNLWVLACNLNNRVTNIENTCCALTCSDIKIGFTVQTDTTGTGVFLKFTTTAGTDIPNGFTDNGSTVTFTDKNGNFITYPLVIANGANLGDFDLSGLDLTDPITIAVTAVMSAAGINCESCVSRVYTIGNATCPVCQIVASGTTGEASIAYQVPGSTNIQTLIIGPGQTSYIQTNAIIMAVATTGDTTVDSTCINLTPPPVTCYTLTWSALELGEANWVEIIVGNLTYTINSVSGVVALFNAIGTTVPPAIMTPVCILENSFGVPYKMSVQVPSTLPIPVFKSILPIFSTVLYMYGVVSTNPSTDCGCNQSSG